MTVQQMVCVMAVSIPAWNSAAVIASSTPDRMYVPEIIFFRPTVSNRCPRISGPARLPTANAMKYSGMTLSEGRRFSLIPQR